jgi:hypothetical protein
MSRRPPAAMVLAAVFKHWDVENGRHWRLDVTLGEDKATHRKDNGPADLAVLRRITMNFVKAHPTGHPSRQNKGRPDGTMLSSHRF